MRTLLSAVVLSWAVGAVSQNPQPFVTGTEVRVVNVEVVVTEASGNPVTDLTPKDFVVLEDGQPVEVTNFFKVVQAQPQLAVNEGGSTLDRSDERFRRRLVLVVDNNFLDPATRSRALEKAKEFLTQTVVGEGEWAVAAIGEDLQYLLPFTTDTFRVAAALDEVSRLPSFATRHRLDFRLENDPIRSQYLQTEEPTRATRYDIGQTQRFASQERARRNLQSFAVTARVLGGLMRSYSSFGGRKAVVLLTGSMEFHPEAQYLVSNDPKTWSDTGLTDRAQSDPALESLKRDTEEVLQALVRAANASGFQLYVINARGLESPLRLHDVENRQLGMVKNLGTFTAPPETSDPETAPLTLVQGTGGLYLRSNQLEKPLARVLEDTSTYYSLGYTPNRRPDRQFHSITVKVQRPGVKVRHRLGYLDLPEDEKLAQELATPLTFPKPKGDLPVELALEERGPEGKEFRMAARVTVPLSSLVFVPQPGGGVAASCTVFLAVYNEKGENLTVVPKSFPLAVPAGQEGAIKEGVFRPTLLFTVPPGAYTVSATVFDAIAHQHGTALEEVLVGPKP
ncbi:MAG: VWA domain-containing protein [Thermoanaerobaculum sp.]